MDPVIMPWSVCLYVCQSNKITMGVITLWLATVPLVWYVLCPLWSE